MPTISVRVDEETKEQMDERETVNWSATLREKITEVLTEERAPNRARAVRLNERVYNTALDRMKEAGVDAEGVRAGAEIVREWRDRRYGPAGEEAGGPR